MVLIFMSSAASQARLTAIEVPPAPPRLPITAIRSEFFGVSSAVPVGWSTRASADISAFSLIGLTR